MAVGDWVPCVRYGQQQTADLNLATGYSQLDVLLVVPGDTLGTVPEVGVVEEESEVLTKRVIGWVTHRVSLENDNTLICHERIRVGLQQADGDQSFFAEDLQAADEANEPFLWERVSLVEMTQTVVYTWPDPTVGSKDYSFIDVPVARKLRRSDVLVYSVQWTPVTVNILTTEDVISTFVHLRTWAKQS